MQMSKMIHQKLISLLLICSCWLFMVNASHAVLFNFEYTFNSNQTLTGMLEGDIQADGDTVIVSSVMNVEYSRLPSLVFPELNPRTVSIFGDFFASFSGNNMFLIASPSGPAGTPQNPSWDILNNSPIISPPRVRIVDDASPTPNQQEFETFATERWSLVDKSASPVPVPSAFLLFGTGLISLVAWRWWSAKKAES